MASGPKLSRRLRFQDFIWGLVIGSGVGLASNLLPQASATRALLVAFIAGVLVLVLSGFWPAISPIFPTVQVRPPLGFGKARLRRETASLVARMRDYIRTGPAPIAGMMRQDRITTSNDPSVMEQWERQKQDLDRHFASNVRHVLQQYQARGLVDDRHAAGIEWDCHDLFHLGNAAT